jgi:hypothetical protein
LSSSGLINAPPSLETEAGVIITLIQLIRDETEVGDPRPGWMSARNENQVQVRLPSIHHFWHTGLLSDTTVRLT